MNGENIKNMGYINNMRNKNKEKTEKLENRKDSHNNFKKNMKKILSVALAVLAISGVTACRNQSYGDVTVNGDGGSSVSMGNIGGNTDDGNKNDTNTTNTVKDSVIIAVSYTHLTLPTIA